MTELTDQKGPLGCKAHVKDVPGQRGSKGKTKSDKSTKADALVRLLSRAKGATVDDMMKATGWQAHSVRGFMAGTLKKKLGQAVASEKTDKGRVYRLSPVGDAE